MIKRFFDLDLCFLMDSVANKIKAIVDNKLRRSSNAKRPETKNKSWC